MEGLGDEIRRELARFGPAEGMGRIVEAWPQAVGQTIARNAWPARLARDGTLHVAARDSVWAFELGQQEAQIRERLGDLAPRALRFAPGPLPEPPAGRPAEEPGNPLQEPTAEDRKLAAALASGIEDEELRTLVARAAAASLARGADRRGL